MLSAAGAYTRFASRETERLKADDRRFIGMHGPILLSRSYFPMLVIGSISFDACRERCPDNPLPLGPGEPVPLDEVFPIKLTRFRGTPGYCVVVTVGRFSAKFFEKFCSVSCVKFEILLHLVFTYRYALKRTVNRR